MDIHKPKPIHSLRELLTEIGVIVIGVAIALSAEQGVEWYHWQGKVALAREQIAGEMALNFYSAINRVRSSHCVEERLDRLAAILDEGEKSGALPPVGDIGLPMQRPFRRGVWDSVVASQTATHFPSLELQRLGIVYAQVQKSDEAATQEMEEWKALYGIVGPGRRLDPASAAVLRQALSQARGSNRIITNASNQLFGRGRLLNLPLSAADRAMLEGGKQIKMTGNKPTVATPIGYGICDPIGPVPATYGQGPISAMPSLLDEAVKAIPDFSGSAK
jgi:hypothetical protein